MSICLQSERFAEPCLVCCLALLLRGARCPRRSSSSVRHRLGVRLFQSYSHDHPHEGRGREDIRKLQEEQGIRVRNPPARHSGCEVSDVCEEGADEEQTSEMFRRCPWAPASRRTSNRQANGGRSVPPVEEGKMSVRRTRSSCLFKPRTTPVASKHPSLSGAPRSRLFIRWMSCSGSLENVTAPVGDVFRKPEFSLRTHDVP